MFIDLSLPIADRITKAIRMSTTRSYLQARISMTTRHGNTTRVQRPSSDSPSLTSVGFLIHLAQMRLRGGVVAAIEGSGLHPGHLAVIGALNDRGGMSQRRLGDITQIEKSSMVLFLDMLEAGGWVRRARDPGDRRAHIVALTEEGARKFAGLGPRLKAMQDRFLAPLTQAEHETLVALLMRLAADPPES
jgi:DNA-binding MarR family transcriptional regulator